MTIRRLTACLFVATMVFVGCKSSTKPAPRTATARATPAVDRPTSLATPAQLRTPSPTPRPGSTAAAASTPTVVSRVGEPGLFTLSATGVVPETVTVQAGRTAAFQNNDTVTHRLVSNEPGLFDTGDIAPGDRATVQPGPPGEHAWHDTRDARLKGTLRVLP